MANAGCVGPLPDWRVLKSGKLPRRMGSHKQPAGGFSGKLVSFSNEALQGGGPMSQWNRDLPTCFFAVPVFGAGLVTIDLDGEPSHQDNSGNRNRSDHDF